MKTRAELDAAIDELTVCMPTLIAETQESDQMVAFAGLADEIEQASGPDDHAHVSSRLQCTLRDSGR